ncbi:MAG: hypothetical protein ACE5MM_03640, partial [Nitrospiraceae bacterium]
QAGGLAAQSVNVLFTRCIARATGPRYAPSSRGTRRVPIAPRLQWVQRHATAGYPLRCYCNGWNATNRHE